jgi:biopolymer transport protein TolR
MAFGRLERSTAPAPMSDINMTPLIDVMLVLVVIFILTAPLMVSTVPLQLPVSGAAQNREVPQTVLIALDASGQLYLDNQPLSLLALTTRLQEIGQRQPQSEIQLRADERVPYGRVVEVLGLAQQAGLSRVGFVAKP